jgi:hypothetical protein
MWILIAGPYLSGTGNNPDLIKKNMEKLEAVALPIFRKGHLPLIGEWVALPLIRLAGSGKIGDAIWSEIQYPVAGQLIEKCDAVLRLPGESKGADNDVQIAQKRGIKIFYKLEDIPEANTVL